jgi:hypothetical protein
MAKSLPALPGLQAWRKAVGGLWWPGGKCASARLAADRLKNSVDNSFSIAFQFYFKKKRLSHAIAETGVLVGFQA